MPLLVRLRRYDKTFWSEVLGGDRPQRNAKQIKKDLGLGEKFQMSQPSPNSLACHAALAGFGLFLRLPSL